MTIEANAFLYRMVRSIVGTLLQVGRGELSLAKYKAAFEAADRTQAGPTAPPQGLCLIEVRYPDLGTRRPDLRPAQPASD
jgi:tRNA pseudouridine38-40 synthase